MEIYFKYTAGLLLMVLAFQLASLQDSTDSPGRTINPNWLRDLTRNKTGRQNAVVAEESSEDDPGASATETSHENGGIPSGYMLLEDDVNFPSRDTVGNTSDELPHALPNGETDQPELSNATDSQTTQPTNSSRSNETEAEEESHDSTTTPQNSTAHSISPNSTNSPDFSNRTDVQSATSAPESNGTKGSETEPEGEVVSSSSTASPSTTSTAPQEQETSITPSSTTAFPPETTGTSQVPPTFAAEQGNKTDKDGASGSSTDRGVSSHDGRRSNAWGAVLGTAVAVSCVGLVAYIILKKKQQKAFAHRKLVENFPSDPVLRLDNSEPLDLNFGRAAYFNPGLQGDNIQMSNFPGHYRT